jgi:predicted outer membrane repeat protein
VAAAATMDTVSFLDNEATNYGGAMYIKEARLDATGLLVSGNVAESGGGLWLDDGTTVIEDSVITGNSSNTEGGGILAETSVAGASLLLQDTEVSYNDAAVGGGLWVKELPTECAGDRSSDRYGLFGNSGWDVYIATTTDVAFTSSTCDFEDPAASPPTDGSVVVPSAGTFSYGKDSVFVCDGAGCI